jgi:acetoin utilization deacetylase AcuC-like enzyme
MDCSPDHKARAGEPTQVSTFKSNSESSASSNSPSFKLLMENFSDAFSLVEQIKNSDEFEDAVFALLRLHGIHAVYQYPKEAQAGRADGFFILNNLAVMYDCTLRDSFEEYKKDQIENYINK